MRFKSDRAVIGVLLSLVCVTHVSAQEELRQASVTFLDETAAKAAIVDDSLALYFDRLQTMEMSAKTGSPIGKTTIQQQHTECRRRYQAAVRTFTKQERDAIRWCVQELHPVLVKEYPLLAQMPWSFLKLSDRIEGGLPHTRGKHIILSETMCRQITMVRQRSAVFYFSALESLAHEQMHVFQRTHPGHLDLLYKNLWGFQKAESIAGCPWLIKHQLVNPDAVDCCWILPVEKDKRTTYLWPLVVFSEGDGLKRMPADFRMLAISLEKTDEGFRVQTDNNGKPVCTDLLCAPEFRDVFPLTGSLYHPDEASADMFAKLLIFDHFLVKAHVAPEDKQKVEKHLAPLRKWFQENLRIRSNAAADVGKPHR